MLPEQADDTSRPLALLRATLLLMALVVVVQAALGFAGFFSCAAAWAAACAAAAASALVLRVAVVRAVIGMPAVAAPDRAAPWTHADMAAAAAVVAAIGDRAWAGLHRTTFLYDVLSYHLHLPAAWRAAGRLQVIPTPFGDPAPAYAPGNAELFHHLALALTGNATLAHAGQVPFAALSALALYTAARVLGAVRAVGFAAALGFLLVPEVWQQASTAMADLTLAAFFLATIPFLLRLERHRSWPDIWGLGLGLGLLLGTKYVAAVLSLPIVLATVFVLTRPGPGVKRGAAVGVVAVLTFVCGGFWYARNLVLTGNPLFPVTFRLGPLTLGRGLYDTAVMRTWEYHLPVSNVHALLEMFLDSGWGFLAALAAAVALSWRSRWPLVGLLMTCLVWFVVPYQQSRFFFCVWGVGALMLAVASTRAPRFGLALWGLATLGSIVEFPTSGRLGLLAAAAAGAVLGPPLVGVLARVRRRNPALLLATSGAIVALASIATLGWARTHLPAPAAVGDAHDEGWAWIGAHAHGVRIAYAGSNLPLPLWGPRFENDVRYVNVSGGPDAGLHDFRNVPPATRPTPEPAPDRAMPDQQAWLANLAHHRIDLLFVAALYPIVRDTIGHDTDGFPIERAWADARPDLFAMSFANAGIRIYRRRSQASGTTLSPAGSVGSMKTRRGRDPEAQP